MGSWLQTSVLPGIIYMVSSEVLISQGGGAISRKCTIFP